MAMMTVSKSRRLVNPGKRKLSPLQKLFFGSKRQRAAVAKRRNPSIRKSKKAMRKVFHSPTKHPTMYNFYGRGATGRTRTFKKRKKNVGSIVTVLPFGLNPGRRKSYKRRKSNKGKRVVIVNKGVRKMATRKRTRRTKSHKVTIRRRRRNPVYRGRIKRGVYKYTSNPGRRRRRYARRRNPGVTRHTRRYRRNPGSFATGVGGRVLGVIGGVAVTKLLCGFLPVSFQTGIMGYLATGAVAVLQGKLAGKFSKSPALGNDMMVGGLAYLTAKVLNDFLPSIGGYTGISGMGLIGPSSFYNPQVPMGNSMGAFQVPSAVSRFVGSSMPPANTGVGRLRRTGRIM